MLHLLMLTAVLTLVGAGLLTALTWCTARRIRRSRRFTTARDVAADTLLVLAALRSRRPGHHKAVLAALRISRAHRQLRQRIGQADKAGAYLGDVAQVLPRLESESRRIRSSLTHSLTSTRPADGKLLARAQTHLGALTDLNDALSTISVLPAAEDTLAQETLDAARGLRLYATAYTELTATGLTAPNRYPAAAGRAAQRAA